MAANPQPVPGLVPMEIKITEAQLDEIKARLGGMSKGLPIIMMRAINRGLQTVRGQLSRRVAKKLGLPVRPVRALLRMTWAKRNKLAGRLRIMPYGLSYYWYKPRETPVGVQLTKGPKTLIPHAWIARIRKRQKYPGVYVRKGKARFPVKAFRTPSMVDEFYELGGKSYFITLAQSTVNKRLLAETELILSGKRRFYQASQPIEMEVVT